MDYVPISKKKERTVGRGKYVHAPTAKSKISNPKWMANAVVNNPGTAVAGLALGGAGLALANKDKLSEEGKKAANVGAAAAVGGTAGLVGAKTKMYRAKSRYEKVTSAELKNAKGNWSGPHRKNIDRHLKASRQKAGGFGQPGYSERKAQEYFNRDFPENIPGSKDRRYVANFDGKKTSKYVAGGTAATGVPTAAAQDRKKVEKRLNVKGVGSKAGDFVDAAVGTTRKKTLYEPKYQSEIQAKFRPQSVMRNAKLQTRTTFLNNNGEALRKPITETAGGGLTTTGKVVVGGTAAYGGGAGLVAVNNRSKNKPKAIEKRDRNMSQREIDARKKAQAAISRTTGALGLASLGTLALSHGKINPHVVATAGKHGRKVTPRKLKDLSSGLAIGGAGIGGAGSFNFASYSSAEARQRKKAMAPVKKSDGEFAKAEKKKNRSDNAVIGGAAATYLGANTAAYQGARWMGAKDDEKFAREQLADANKATSAHMTRALKAPRGEERGFQNRTGALYARRAQGYGEDVKAAVEAAKGPRAKTLAAGAATAGGIGAMTWGAQPKKKRVKKSDDTSAFGIEH